MAKVLVILLGADPLSRFLNGAAATPFEWGRFDCLLWLADWIKERRGFDPAARLRGTYSTMREAAQIVRRSGGMSALVDTQTRPGGILRANEGSRGDIAIVSIAGDGGEHFGNQAGAILLSGSAALICQVGLITPRLDDLETVAVWRV